MPYPIVIFTKYAFPAIQGSSTRGMPTGYAAPPLNRLIQGTSADPPVWPDPEGEVRGYELAPLYRSVPKAACADPELYELLALVDAIREGRAREATLAIQELKTRLELTPLEMQGANLDVVDNIATRC